MCKLLPQRIYQASQAQWHPNKIGAEVIKTFIKSIQGNSKIYWGHIGKELREYSKHVEEILGKYI